MKINKVFKILTVLILAIVMVGCSGLDASYKDLKSPCGTKAGKRKPLRNPE